MRITRLELHSYRNYEILDLRFDPGVQIFLGANAQGKTNIIEALYYASFGRSHRTTSDAELIRMGESAGRIDLSFLRHDVPGELSFTFERGHRRRILRAGEPLRQRELVGLLPMVLFSPEDLFLVKGAPALRRRYLDAELSQASPAYYGELLRYTHILRQRGAVLKDIRERLAPVDALLYAGFFAIGIGAANIVPVFFSLMGKQNVMPIGAAVSAVSTMGYLGILAGPAAIGLVSHLVNLQAAFGILAALCLLQACVGMHVFRRIS